MMIEAGSVDTFCAALLWKDARSWLIIWLALLAALPDGLALPLEVVPASESLEAACAWW